MCRSSSVENLQLSKSLQNLVATDMYVYMYVNECLKCVCVHVWLQVHASLGAHVTGHHLPSCLRQDCTCQAGWPISFRTFSCLCFPSFHSNTGITGVNYLVWLYMGSGIPVWLFPLLWEVLYSLSPIPIPRGRNSAKLVERKSEELVSSWHSCLLPAHLGQMVY